MENTELQESLWYENICRDCHESLTRIFNLYPDIEWDSMPLEANLSPCERCASGNRATFTIRKPKVIIAPVIAPPEIIPPEIIIDSSPEVIAPCPERLSRTEKNLRVVQKAHEETLATDTRYENLLLYLAENGKIGGFQAVESKIEQFMVDYFNDTGEEIPEENICILSPKTYGNALRLYFTLPAGMTFEELKNIWPEMPKIYCKDYEEPNSLPIQKDDGEIVITNNLYVRALLQMGFRHGKNHCTEKIIDEIERIKNQ